MAVFRKIHVTFWEDPFVHSLTPEQKYFYLYLLTNSKTTQCGIYEITLAKISFETGYNSATVDKLIKHFVVKGKIKYSTISNEIAIKNWGKYNDSTSPKVKSCIEKELKSVKDRVLIQYLYSMDTHTQEEKEKEKEEKKKIPSLDEFLKYCELKSDKFPKIKYAAKMKYEAWVENGWKDGHEKEIVNWKSKLLQTIPHLTETKNETVNPQVKTLDSILSGKRAS